MLLCQRDLLSGSCLLNIELLLEGPKPRSALLRKFRELQQKIALSA